MKLHRTLYLLTRVFLFLFRGKLYGASECIMPSFYFSHWIEKISSQPSKLKVNKKKIPPEIEYLPFLFFSHFPIFPPNLLFSPYSSSVTGRVLVFSHFFSTFPLIFLFSPYSSPTYLHIYVFRLICAFQLFSGYLCFPLFSIGFYFWLFSVIFVCCWVFSGEIF